MKKIISLFSGCGGFDIGFHEHGFEVEVCVDNDSAACETIRRNTNWRVFEGDIAEFSFEGPKGEIAGVIGGPPCQGFSPAGRGNPKDPRNSLWREYFRIVREAQPEFIVLENVPGMLFEKNAKEWNDLLKVCEDAGFYTSFGVLDSADFGVPQHRRRLFVVGSRKGKVELPEGNPNLRVTVQEALQDLERPANVPNHQPNRHAPHVVARWRLLAAGEMDPNYRRGRLDPDKPSVTIRASGGYGPSGKHLARFHPPIHYKFPRQLTVREAARLQGFPDSWIFEGSKTVQGRQVGNAVAPPVAAALAKKIAESLESEESVSKSRANSKPNEARETQVESDAA